MITEATRPRPATRREKTLDLSRKSGLVPRRGLFDRGPGLMVRTTLRRLFGWFWRYAGFLATAGVTTLLLLRVDTGIRINVFGLSGVLVTGAILAHRTIARMRRVAPSARDTRSTRRRALQELELALLALAVATLVPQLTGGIDSPYHPLVYGVAAVVVAIHRPPIAIAAVAYALALELGMAWQAGWLWTRVADVIAHGVFITLFGGLYHAALASTAGVARSRVRDAIDGHVTDLHERARDYRLIVSESDGDTEAAREKWITAAVDEIESAAASTLELVESALSTHTAGIWVLTPDEKHLRLVECLSDSERVATTPLSSKEGLPGVVLAHGRPVRLHGEFRGAVYYEGGQVPKSFIGVPLIDRTVRDTERGHLRGLLIADRLEDAPFTDQEERFMQTAAKDILRSLHAERVMGWIRKEKDEKSRFYHAIEQLNVLSKPEEIFEAVCRLATEIAPVDLVAVTLTDSASALEDGDAIYHRIVQATGPGTDTWTGARFEDNAGLVSNVVRLGAALPSRDFHLMDKTVVFGPAQKLKGLSTLKVLPLSVGDETVGTLVVGAAGTQALSDEAVRMLSVLAIQAAGSVSRARLFEKTERMATTDGLTGLTNHRRFQELLDGHLASARRYGRPLSLLLTDIDHFKNVNDVYGHPIGDKVLKGFSRILQEQVRDTDIAARYGGEEFAAILPETDAAGAKVIAERIRVALEEATFQTELGPLKVTLSIGVATCPTHAEDKPALIELTDQALYKAKHGGRNQVRVSGELR